MGCNYRGRGNETMVGWQTMDTGESWLDGLNWTSVKVGQHALHKERHGKVLWTDSMDSSLRGSSLSSTSFNQKYNEYYDGYAPATPNIDGIGSSCSSFTSHSSFEIHASGDELFGTNSNQSSIGSNASFRSTTCRSQ